jgi:hypothetical protein
MLMFYMYKRTMYIFNIYIYKRKNGRKKKKKKKKPKKNIKK